MIGIISVLGKNRFSLPFPWNCRCSEFVTDFVAVWTWMLWMTSCFENRRKSPKNPPSPAGWKKTWDGNVRAVFRPLGLLAFRSILLPPIQALQKSEGLSEIREQEQHCSNRVRRQMTMSAFFLLFIIVFEENMTRKWHLLFEIVGKNAGEIMTVLPPWLLFYFPSDKIVDWKKGGLFWA